MSEFLSHSPIQELGLDHAQTKVYSQKHNEGKTYSKIAVWSWLYSFH